MIWENTLFKVGCCRSLDLALLMPIRSSKYVFHTTISFPKLLSQRGCNKSFLCQPEKRVNNSFVYEASVSAKEPLWSRVAQMVIRRRWRLNEPRAFDITWVYAICQLRLATWRPGAEAPSLSAQTQLPRVFIPGSGSLTDLCRNSHGLHANIVGLV